MSDPQLQQPHPRTFAEHVVEYAQAGWPCIVPVPAVAKTPPPPGFTGAAGRDTDPVDLVGWAGSHAEHSIALRMPEGVIGIDVDQYVKAGKQKHGATTLAEHVARWGPLPATWSSTARGSDAGPGESRIMFFRVPGRRYATRLVGSSTGDVEVIQRHHRYAVVAPSPHPDAQTLYRWYDPAGVQVEVGVVPKPDEFPELPPAWVAGLAEGAAEQGPASADPMRGQTLLDQLEGDWRPECAEVTSARLTAAAALAKADEGTRHDVMAERAYHLIQTAAAGHTGVAAAVLELRTAWEQLTAGEDRADELERALRTAAQKAVTVVGSHQVPRDPCLLVEGFPLPPMPERPPGGPADESAEGEELELVIAEPPRWLSTREVIGTAAFDPNAGLDQPLAEAVLARTFPALRYAYDSDGWLLRAPDRWELHKRLSPWAVAQVATLMPLGDPTAEKGSEPHERAKRRARLMGTPGARAVAGKMDDLVSGGMHPAAVALAGLDADPELLWAGGVPWSLRESRHGAPAPADLDPTTPHQHTAGVAPEQRPTPLWDDFLAAVWPDPAVRAWAIRVLSIALTGHADRALPILLGETGRGKTQVVALIMSVLGSYAHAADPRLMSEAGEKAHASIVFALKGRRLSFVDEGPREGRWAQERLKQLTGGGELTANQMNQNPITFRPTHTLVLTANDEPVLTDPAVRSRVRLITCEGDPELIRAARAAIGHVSGPAWRAEAPGVLAALMAEAGSWLHDPLTASTAAAPEHLRYLAEHLGAEQDPVAVWVAEETEPSEVGTPSRELYQAFVASCRRNSMRADAIPSETKWGRSLTRLDYPSWHTATGKRRGLQLRAGGFLPGMGPAPTASQQIGDGYPTSGDGSVTPTGAQPSAEFSQVNLNDSVPVDGCDESSNLLYAHAHTPAHTGTANGDLGVNPSQPDTKTGADLGKQASDEPSRPVESGQAPEKPAKKRREQTESARQRAVEAREAKRLAAVEAASGRTLELPAVVDRGGRVTPCSAADADALLATITNAAGSELTVDVENTGYPVGHEHYALRTVQLGGEAFAVVLDPSVPKQADVARRHLGAAAMLHAHSATADLVPLVLAGLVERESAWARMDDTVIAAKLADPALTGSDPGLKRISASMLGEHGLSAAADEARAALFKAGKWLTDTEVTTPLEKSGWAQVDPRSETMIRYAGSDVLDDAAIARLLPKPTPAVMHRERTAARMVARIAHDGIRIDGDQVARLRGEHRAAWTRLAEQINGWGVSNPGSNAQVAAKLAELGAPLARTRTGKLSVAKAAIEPFSRDEGPVGDLTRLVLGYRHHDTALKLLLEPWHELATRGDGRARPTVYTLGADTGRMSCVRPNLQQVSREGGLRACFTADPGQVLISADFAGVELRVAAALSGDPALRAYATDDAKDLHWDTARLAFGPQATKADRYAVKRGVFGRIYGGGVQAIANGVGVSQAVARQIIDTLDGLLPGLTEWSRMVRNAVEAGHTQFPTYAGRVIHLPRKAPHAGPNYCIQGTARELLIDTLVRWADTRWADAVLFPVHDELVIAVPEEDAAEATATLEVAMTSELFGVPIKAEASTPSYSWSDSV